MSMTTIYAISLGIILFISVSAFFTPVRIALKAVLRTLGGFAALVAFNLAANVIGLFVGVNLANALIIGLFGPVGLLLLLLLQWSFA